MGLESSFVAEGLQVPDLDVVVSSAVETATSACESGSKAKFSPLWVATCRPTKRPTYQQTAGTEPPKLRDCKRGGCVAGALCASCAAAELCTMAVALLIAEVARKPNPEGHVILFPKSSPDGGVQELGRRLTFVAKEVCT